MPGTVVPWVDLVISGPVVVSIGKIVVPGTAVVPWADVVTSGVVSRHSRSAWYCCCYRNSSSA